MGEPSESFLSERELRKLRREREKRKTEGLNPYWSIDEVRAYVRNNSAKEHMDTRGDHIILDPDAMFFIDIRVDYPVFVTRDEIYTRAGLITQFPFQELKTTPESVFAQQELGAFVAAASTDEKDQAAQLVARDIRVSAGDGDGAENPDDADFGMVEDLVARAAGSKRPPKYKCARLIKTKIFVGKDRWDSFVQTQSLIRGVRDFVCAPLLAGGAAAEQSRLTLGDTADLLGRTMMGLQTLTLEGNKKAEEDRPTLRE